ncbi:MAG TPA: rod shape-determining protein MreD [Coriobacteriia bacterium]|nr:rod shape-determining protein MreD [Coriobacteriia bacterium]
MNRVIPTVVAVLVAAVLQAGLAPYLAIGGVTPNFLLIVAITLALVNGPTQGASAGFAAGLIFDLLGSGPVGPMALVLAVTGYLVGLLHEQMFAEGWLLPLTVLAVGALATEVAYGLILGLLGEGAPFVPAFFTTMLPAAVYDTVLALLVYPWLARFLRRDRPMTTFRRLA